jgi:mono/diheme cytochrome c family protein
VRQTSRSPATIATIASMLAATTAATAAPVSYETVVKPILAKRCVSCHFGTFDLTDFPFVNSSYPTQEAIVAEMIRRMELADTNWRRMPPPNVHPERMPAEEILSVKRWLEEGLNP